MYIRCIDTVFQHLFQEGKLMEQHLSHPCFHHVNPCTGWEGHHMSVNVGWQRCLHEIQIHGLPSATSRSSVKRARRDADIEACAKHVWKGFFCQESLRLKEKGTVNKHFPFVHPLAFVQHCLTECQPFRDYFIKYILPFGQDPSSPIEKLELVWL